MNKNIKILLVDDEPGFLEIMGKFFSRRQIQFEVANNCMEAMDQLGKVQFDVVVMDVSMPGLDGIACMREMKKVFPEVEIIILTGHASLDLSLKGMKDGAFDYCLKPTDFNELLEKIILADKKHNTSKLHKNENAVGVIGCSPSSSLQGGPKYVTEH